jgi:hypothetical protein
MAAVILPSLEIPFTDTLTPGGATAKITITLPAGATYLVTSVTLTGTNAGTQCLVTANNAGTTIIAGGTVVGNVTFTFPIYAGATATTNIQITAQNLGTITGGSVRLAPASPLTLTTALSVA